MVKKTQMPALAIIPARKGSKRLPDKNKLPIDGKPLFEWAIDVAKKSGIFTSIIVSSDDMEILERSYELGAMPHKRPGFLAGDRAELRYVCQQILDATDLPVFCLLTPTNPLRTPDDIRVGYDMMLGRDTHYVMSVVPFNPSLETALKLNNKGFIDPLSDTIRKQSQRWEHHYRHDGTFIFALRDIFLSELDFNWYGTKVLPYFVKHPSVDIDTMEDYQYAKYLMEVKDAS